jgi:serum/glucocorticoid-regulated kinase 2
MDFAGCKDDKQIEELLAENESIILSALVYKYNHVNKRQQRILLVTTKAIYNIAKPNIITNFFSLLGSASRMKRRIGFENVFGMTVSRYGYEFILHVNNEHDYRYSSTDQ